MQKAVIPRRKLNQWVKLKTHFESAVSTKECYSAQILYVMFSCDKNLSYILFLHPVIGNLQKVPKVFESNFVDIAVHWKT